MKEKKKGFLFCFLLLGILGCASVPEIRPPRLPKRALRPEEGYYLKALLKVVDALYEVDTLDTALEQKKYLDKLLQITPGEAEVYWRYARLCAWMWEWEQNGKKRDQWAQKGLEYAGKGLYLNPNSVATHYYYALCLGMYLDCHKTAVLKGVPKLIRHAKRACKIDETFDYAGPHRLLGRVYLEAPEHLGGDLDKAIEHLERAVELFPGYPENLYSLALAYLEDEEREEATKLLEKVAFSHFEVSPRILYTTRIKALEKLAKLYPKREKYLLKLIELYIQQGERKKAEKLLEAAQKQYSSPRVQKRLAQLRTHLAEKKKSP